ncbi:MAG: type VII toxin-antitoxin system HepT family RNase toxin [Bacillota bacterium]
MSPLDKSQKESIIRRLSFVQVEMDDLKAYHGLDRQTYHNDRVVRRNVERIAENLANALIDIGKIVLSGENIIVPGTYREIFDSLGEIGLIPEQLAQRLAELSRARNVLAQQYLDIKWETVAKFIQEAPEAVMRFMEIVRNILLEK